VDSAWEQEKLEARKMLENAAESHMLGAPLHDDDIIFHNRNRGAMTVYSKVADA
jgi:hypothetical protein